MMTSIWVNIGLRCYPMPLQWRHNGRDGHSNHQPHHYLLNRLFRRKWKKNQSSASLVFGRGIHRWPVNSTHKWPVMWEMFPFDGIIMEINKQNLNYINQLTDLTLCVLVTPYRDTDLGLYWLTLLLIAWRHQAITWGISIDFASVRSSDVHLREILEEISYPTINRIGLQQLLIYNFIQISPGPLNWKLTSQCWSLAPTVITLCFVELMMTSSNGNIFRVTGHLCREFTGPRWIPRTKTSDAELWCFLWSASE